METPCDRLWFEASYFDLLSIHIFRQLPEEFEPISTLIVTFILKCCELYNQEILNILKDKRRIIQYFENQG